MGLFIGGTSIHCALQGKVDKLQSKLPSVTK